MVFHTSNRSGFTLIEAAIVLIVIGLIMGGIFFGRDLIEAARIRAQISQIEEFKSAVDNFTQKYASLPGDMPPSQASRLGFFTFTGAYAGTICGTAAFGNADGSISNYGMSNFGWTNGESFAFWAHLSSAKLIKGEYGNVTGNALIAATATCLTSPPPGVPTNGIAAADKAVQFLPPSAFPNASVYVTGNYHIYPSFSFHYYNDTKKENMFAIRSTIKGTLGSWTSARSVVLSPSHLYQIDSKIDDGMPTSGDVRAAGTTNSMTGAVIGLAPCTTTSPSPLQYDLSSTTIDNLSCGIDFLF